MSRVQSIVSHLKAAQWVEPLHVPGLRVFQTGARVGSLEVHSLPGAPGVVIGRTFVRPNDALDDSPMEEWRATPVEAQTILASKGRWLIERCWGNYVAVLQTSDGRVAIVKDPVGNLPCYVAASGGVTLIFSSADDLVRLGLCRFTVNMDYVRTRVLYGNDLRRSPLNDIEQVRRGECVELDPDRPQARSHEFLWDPQAFVRGDAVLEDPRVAARAMRASVRMSTHTWAAREARIVVRLSGGLDSSIIAGVLNDAPNRPELDCYTYFNPGAPSDERRWARLVAERLRGKHYEVPIRPEEFDLRLAFEQPPQVEPTSILAYTLRSTVEQPIVERAEATLVFNGEGGDSGFGAETVRYAAEDFVQRRGWRIETLRIASDVARYTGESVWAVVRRAMLAGLGKNVPDPFTMLMQASALVNRECVSSGIHDPVSAHPWFASDASSAWPIVRRVGALLAPPVFYDVIGRSEAPEVVSPLFSQPVVETLLRIPLYRLFEDGRDRGLARRAFAADVPQPILTRFWKDRAPGFHDRVAFINRALLRETLLDGVLASEGLLDRDAIEAAFAEGPSKSRARPAEIIRHFDMETWVRAWRTAVASSQQWSACIDGH